MAWGRNFDLTLEYIGKTRLYGRVHIRGKILELSGTKPLAGKGSALHTT
jgi:hypothetical protein